MQEPGTRWNNRLCPEVRHQVCRRVIAAGSRRLDLLMLQTFCVAVVHATLKFQQYKFIDNKLRTPQLIITSDSTCQNGNLHTSCGCDRGGVGRSADDR